MYRMLLHTWRICSAYKRDKWNKLQVLLVYSLSGSDFSLHLAPLYCWGAEWEPMELITKPCPFSALTSSLTCWFHVMCLKTILYTSGLTCVPLFAYAHMCIICIVFMYTALQECSEAPAPTAFSHLKAHGRGEVPAKRSYPLHCAPGLYFAVHQPAASHFLFLAKGI